MKIDQLITNPTHTVGIALTSNRSGATRIKGFFDKNLFREAITKYFDAFDSEDLEIRVLEGEDGKSSLLLMYPSDSKEVAICICGRTERHVAE